MPPTAQLVSATPKGIYAIAGKNYAPKRPLDEMLANKRTSNPNPLCDALRDKYNNYKQRDYASFIENCNVGRAVSNLRSGKLLLLRSVTDGRYLFVKRDGRHSDNKTVGGKFQFYSTKLNSEWLSSQPELDPVCPSQDDQIEQLISDIKIIQDAYNRKFFGPENVDYETRESHSAQDFGTWITRFRYDVEQKDIVCELLEFPACRWDTRFIAEESPYFIYESKVATSVLKDLLDADISSDGDSPDNYGLQVIEQLAKTGGNISGQGKNQPYGTYNAVPNENVVTEMWLQPQEYCDIDIDRDEKTLGGGTIKAGKSLVDLFPKGMCVTGINGMQTILQICAENHKDHIVSGLYHVQSFSGVGKGISDAVDVMKDLNDLHSQLLAHVKTHAMPGFGYNSAMVTESDAKDIGKARKNIPFDFTQAPEGVRSINDVVQAITPGNPAQSAFNFKQTLEADLQMSMQVTDFSNGLPGVDNKTATGAKIGDANAEMVLVAQHLNKASHRRRSAKVIFNLFTKYIDAPKWFSTNAKNGITAGKYLTGTQFDGVDVDFQIVSNSQIAQTPYQQKDSLSQMFQFTGGAPGFAQLKQMDVDLASEIADAFGAKLSVPKTNDIARVCRKRIEQAKKILEIELKNQQLMKAVMPNVPVDNANLASQIVSQVYPPISPKEPHFQQKIEWLADLLDADEMQFAPPELRYVIEEMIDRHLMESTLGQAQVQQDQNIANIMANMPMLLGEQALNQQNQQLAAQAQQQQQAQQQDAQMQQMQAQNAQGMQQAGQQMLLKQHEADIQNKQAQADHQYALAQSDDAHRKNLELEQMRQQAQQQNQPTQ